MAKKLAVVGIFAYLNELLSAVEGLRNEKIRISAVYSPMRIEEVREALGEPALGRGTFLHPYGSCPRIFDRGFSCRLHCKPVAVHSRGQASDPDNTFSYTGFRVLHSDSCVLYTGRFSFSEQVAENAPPHPLR